jgi:MarR family 2-MHQ and catechol resistance regulon transcriptional repressor
VPKAPRRKTDTRDARRETKRPEPKRRDTSGTHVWLVLMKSFRAMAQHASQSIEQLDLAFTDFTILEALLNKGPLLVNDIGRRVNLTSGSITSAVDRLEERGFVERSTDTTDKRARVVSLTAGGRELIEKAFDAHKARMDGAADTLTVAERKALIGLLKKLGLGAADKLEGGASSRG